MVSQRFLNNLKIFFLSYLMLSSLLHNFYVFLIKFFIVYMLGFLIVTVEK